MRRMMWFTAIVLVCGSLCGCERRAMFGKSDEAAIRELFTEYQKDWNAHDMQALGNLFTVEHSGLTSSECIGAGSPIL
jgi:hypothetical protein